MTPYSLQEIKNRVDELACKISAPAILLPSYGYSIGDSTPCIEIDNNGLMYFIISERGVELERKMTDNIDELLYWIFDGITFSMASNFELNNRVFNKDSRRLLFNKQEELLERLNETWKQLRVDQNKIILEKHPFRDLPK